MSRKLLLSFAVRPAAGERMKMSGLRSRVLILTALIFFVRTGLSQESNGFWPLSGEFSGDVTYVGEGDVQRGGKNVNDFDGIDSHLAFQMAPRCPIHCSPSARSSGSIRNCPIPFSSERRLSLACTIQASVICFGIISTCLLSSAARTFSVLTCSLSSA